MKSYPFRAFIKDIFLEVPDYRYNHKPNSKEDDKQIFIGRERLGKTFLEILQKGGNNGAYLVTGYRGMGKTSFVNQILRKYEASNPEVQSIKISLAQAKLDEIDVLRYIVNILHRQLRNQRKESDLPFLDYNAFFFSILALLTGAGFLWLFPPGEILCKDDSSNLGTLGIFLAFTTLLFIFVSNLFRYVTSVFNTPEEENKSDKKEDKPDKKHGRFPLKLVWTIVAAIVVTIFLVAFACKPWCFFALPFILLFPIGLYYLFNFREFYALLSLYKRISNLHERSRAQVTNESGEQSFPKELVFNFSGKSSRTYPIATAKEIEYELIGFLQEYNQYEKYGFKKFIFIFDELDKVEMDTEEGVFNSAQFQDSDRTFLNDLRERKQLIIKLLSSLKHLLTEAQARFVFIAGREMFDASLADISDRQSALGSIFHHTFYVGSFMKETKVVNHAEKNVANSFTEEYLCHILLRRFVEKAKKANDAEEGRGARSDKKNQKKDTAEEEELWNKTAHFDEEPFLTNYWRFISHLKKKEGCWIEKQGDSWTTAEADQWHTPAQGQVEDEDLMKILFALQNFMTYLTYRSNGSPKKLIRLIEENFVMGKSLPTERKYLKYQAGKLVIPGKDEKDGAISNAAMSKPGLFTDEMSLIVSSSDTPFEEKTFISFTFREQYKFGFNTYLFFPFLSMQKKVLENYSDSVNVSTPFLMDSLLKFHPFAFSNHNLELLPELLSTNKTPELRFFIQELIDFLGQNHIRETDSGLFKYKFFDKTHHEIAYISRTSEEESAAFNFSLDESHAIKNHIAYKIKYLRNIFKDFKREKSASIESLLFLNDLLGDSQLFDEYYKDAIISLADALHDVKEPDEDTSIEHFLVWMRIKLKLSMVFDKMKYYEMAVGHLGQAMEVALRYLDDRYTAASVPVQKKNQPQAGSVQYKISTPLYRELLHVTQHAILGSLYVQEKFAEGITFAKLENYLMDYAKIHEHGAYSGYHGRDMMMANFYAALGTILYFKNKTLPYRTSVDIRTTDKKNVNNRIKFLKAAYIAIKKTPVFRIGLHTRTSQIELSFAHYISPSYAELYQAFNHDAKRDFRFSLITYIAYKKSLSNFLAVSFEDSLNDPDALDERYFLRHLVAQAAEILVEYRNVHGTKKLIALANSITKIADLLLSLYDDSDKTEVLLETVEKFNAKRKEPDIEETPLKTLDDLVFSDESFGLRWKNPAWNDIMKQNWSSTLKNEDVLSASQYLTSGKSVSLDYVLKMYYLSARLYAKAGRNVACAFQMKKILQALRITGALEKNAGTSGLTLTFLKDVIVGTILRLNSASNYSSDRAQISILRHHTGIKGVALPPDLTPLFYQNISSNPETKEAVLLYALLRIRLWNPDAEKRAAILDSHQAADPLSAFLKEIPEFRYVGQFNSISHQAVRIMELDLQVRVNQIFLQEIAGFGLSIRDNGNSRRVVSLVPRAFPVGYININWQDDLHEMGYIVKYPLEKSGLTAHGQLEDADQKLLESLDHFLGFFGEGYKRTPVYGKSTPDPRFVETLFANYTQVIPNSIFCLHQCILTCNMYGINYMQGPAYLGNFYIKMGDWVKQLKFCHLLKDYLQVNGADEGHPIYKSLVEMDANIDKLMGEPALRNIDDYLSHYQASMEHYRQCIQLHSEGRAYKHQLNDMIYLEDDYGDNLNHFGAAIERQLINSGKITAKLDRLMKELSVSKLLKYDNYIGGNASAYTD